MRSFISEYFDNKSVEKLKRTITPSWDPKITTYHLKLVDVPKDANKVLEIGCGIGRLLRVISDGGVNHCVGIDASQSMIEEGVNYVGDRNVQFFKCSGDGEDIDSVPNYFDFAFSIITFQHIPEIKTIKSYISKVYNLLVDDGEFTFQILSEGMKHNGRLWNVHNRDELIEHSKKVGFKIKKMDVGDKWTFIRLKK